MNDYERVAGVMRILEAEYTKQPSLKELASRVNLSESHFHRLFSRWAGVTPKAFVGCVTMKHAKAMLSRGCRVLETSIDVGLSGPGRLHDLSVHLEGASPGELKAGGAGWTLRHGVADSPFGPVSIADGPRGVCHLVFVDGVDACRATKLVRDEWPRGAAGSR